MCELCSAKVQTISELCASGTMAEEQLERLLSFEDFKEDDGTPAAIPVEPKEESGSLIAEAGTEAGAEEAQDSEVVPAEGPEAGQPVPEPAGEAVQNAEVGPAEAPEADPPAPEPAEGEEPPVAEDERGFVEMIQERSNGEHDGYMYIHRNFIEKEDADKKLFSKGNYGSTRSFPASRIGLEALESAARDLNAYVKGMREYYQKHPNEKPWEHHEAPRNLGINFKKKGWTNHEENPHYWNNPRTFCEPQFRTLLVPTHHFTPEGPRRGMVGISFQEHYDREEMVFDEHPERRQKQARTSSWKKEASEENPTEANAEHAAEATAGTSTASGSCCTPAEPVLEVIMEHL